MLDDILRTPWRNRVPWQPWVNKDSKYAEAYNNRGFLLYELGESEKAIIDYNQSIEINPELAIAYYNRGTFYRKEKQRELALRDLNKTIELDFKFADAYLQRGILFYQEKNIVDCKKNWEKAKELYLQAGNQQKSSQVKQYINQL